MGILQDIQAFKDRVIASIRSKTDIHSITKEEVSDRFNETTDLLKEASLTKAIVTQLNNGKTLGALGTNQSIPANLTLAEFIELVAVETINPIIVDPTATFTINWSLPFYEIGLTLGGLSGTATFNRGQIFQPWDNTVQNPRSGSLSEFVFYKNGVIAQTQTPNTYVYGDHLVVLGIQSYSVVAKYNAGVQPINSKGGNYLTPLPVGSLTRGVSFEGVYPIYATTSNIATLSKQALVSMITTTMLELNLVAESGSNKQTFRLPKSFKTLLGINYFNSVSNQYDSTNKLTDFTKTSIVLGSVDYWEYTYNGPNRGAIKIKLNF